MRREPPLYDGRHARSAAREGELAVDEDGREGIGTNDRLRRSAVGLISARASASAPARGRTLVRAPLLCARITDRAWAGATILVASATGLPTTTICFRHATECQGVMRRG